MFKATREIAFHDRSFKVGEIVPDQYATKRLQDVGAVIFIKDDKECGDEGCSIPEVPVKKERKQKKSNTKAEEETKDETKEDFVESLLVETPADADVTVTVETEE